MTTYMTPIVALHDWVRVETITGPGGVEAMQVTQGGRVIAELNPTRAMRRSRGYWPEAPERSAMHAAYRRRNR